MSQLFTTVYKDQHILATTTACFLNTLTIYSCLRAFVFSTLLCFSLSSIWSFRQIPSFHASFVFKFYFWEKSSWPTQFNSTLFSLPGSLCQHSAFCFSALNIQNYLFICLHVLPSFSSFDPLRKHMLRMTHLFQYLDRFWYTVGA